MESKLIHIDCDTGVDDALAILLAALSPEIQIAGITTVAGNTSARQAAVNSQLLLARMGKQIPVHTGPEMTVDGLPVLPVPSVHGPDGFGGLSLLDTSATSLSPPGGAVELMLENVRRYGSRLTLIATGPASNLARAIQIDPKAMRQVGRIIWMGGSMYEGGNIRPTAEFNAYSDPAAVRNLFAASIPVTVIPLDVTHRVRMMADELQQHPEVDPQWISFLRDLTRIYMQFHLVTNGFSGCYMHDVLTVAYLLAPELFTIERHRVEVILEGDERGRTVIAPAGSGPVDLAMGVDEAGVRSLFWKALGRAVRH